MTNVLARSATLPSFDLEGADEDIGAFGGDASVESQIVAKTAATFNGSIAAAAVVDVPPGGPTISAYLMSINSLYTVSSSAQIDTSKIPQGYDLVYSTWGVNAKQTDVDNYATQGLYAAVFYNSSTQQYLVTANGPSTLSPSSAGNPYLASNTVLATAAQSLDLGILASNPEVKQQLETVGTAFLVNANAAVQAIGIGYPAITPSDTYGAGMSLGGAFIEAMALAGVVSGGYTVGAPGLPGYVPSGATYNIVNQGSTLDGIFNWATDAALSPDSGQYHVGSVVQTGPAWGNSLIASLYALTKLGSIPAAVELGLITSVNHTYLPIAQADGVNLGSTQSNSISNINDVLGAETSLLGALQLGSQSWVPISATPFASGASGIPGFTIDYSDGTTGSVSAVPLLPSQYLILYSAKLYGENQNENGWLQEDPNSGATTVASVQGSGAQAEIQTFVNNGSGAAESIAIGENSSGQTTFSGSGAFLVNYVTGLEGQPVDKSGWIQIASEDPTFALSNGQEITVAAASGQSLDAGGGAPAILVDSVGGNNVAAAAGQATTVVSSNDNISVASGSGTSANVDGNANTITAGNSDSLSVDGANDSITANGSVAAAIYGGGDWVYDDGTGNAASIYNTGGVWDTVTNVSGSTGNSIYENGSVAAAIYGGGSAQRRILAAPARSARRREPSCKSQPGRFSAALAATIRHRPRAARNCGLFTIP